MAAGSLRQILASFGVEFDGAQLAKGDSLVSGMVDKLAGFGKVVAGAFAVHEIVDFTKEVLEQADVLAKQSGALGISASELQGWQWAAKLSGSSAEEFTSAFTKFTRNVNEASESAGGPAAKAFKALGVSIKDSSGNLGAPIDLLDGVVAGLVGIQDPAKRTALVMDLFGKSGARLLPLFNEGPEGLKKLRAEVDDLGASFDEAFLQDAQEVNDNVDRLKLGMRGLAIQILKEVLPGIVAFSKGAVDTIKQFVGWIKHTKLIQAALGLLTIKGVMALWKAIPALIARLGGMRVILASLGRFILRTLLPFLILEDILVFLAGGKSALGKGLDAAFGPGTAKNIQALVAEMVKFFGLFKTEPGKVRAAFATLPDDMAKSLGGFGKFLGGWGQGIVEVGLFAANALTGGWDNFVNKAKAAGLGFLLAIKIVWTEIKFAGLGAAAAMSDAFDAMWSGILKGANAALNALADVSAALPGGVDIADSLRKTGASLLEGAPKGNARETVGKLHDAAGLALASEGDRIGALATAPAGAGPTTVTDNSKNTVNVTVPPTTPEAMARDVGAAAAKGGASLRGAKAALVPTAG
jgi:hypothetical protein